MLSRRNEWATPGRAATLAVAVLLAALLLQAVLSMRLLSATFDETTHLPSGYTYLATGDFRLNPQHPPLVKLLAAVPLTALRPELDLNDPGWNAAAPDEWGFGYRFLYGNDADRLLFWGRFPIVLLAVLMAAYVYRWASELFGRGAGLTALALCAFSPTVIAHARFVTFDVPLACFSTLTLYHLWRRVRGGGRLHLILAGVGLGLALASKFSGILLVGIAAALLGASALWPAPTRAPATAPPASRARRALGAAGSLAVLLALAAFVVEAAYFFPLDPTVYWDGLRRVNVDHAGDFAYFLAGQFEPGGWWYYFLAAFLIKTPLPALLALLAAVATLRRYRAACPLDEAFLIVPVVVYVVATSALADDLGVRYLLPIYPLLFVFASRIAQSLASGRAARVAAAVLGLWYVSGTLAIYPDHLAYFNEAVGGAANGHRWLDDSNIDWGQDVKRLARYLERNDVGSVRVRLGPLAAPDYYGIRALPVSDREWAAASPSPGVYVFSTHLLIRGELHARERALPTDWLSRYEPIDRVGYSLYLFRFE